MRCRRKRHRAIRIEVETDKWLEEGEREHLQKRCL